MKMPEPFGYLCEWRSPSSMFKNTQVFYEGEQGNAIDDDWNSHPDVYKNLPLYTKQALIDLLEAAIEVDWMQVMREGGLVTWGDADTLGDRVIEKLRKLKETL